MTQGRDVWKRVLMVALSLTGVLLFTGLGLWQVGRRAWKLALIGAGKARPCGPGRPPPPASWFSISAARDQYRRITAEGQLLNDRQTLVKAVTEQGAGYWVMTSLRITSGPIALVNRGYVPPEGANRRSRAQALPAGNVRIIGSGLANGAVAWHLSVHKIAL